MSSDVAVSAGADAASRLSHDGRCDRRAIAKVLASAWLSRAPDNVRNVVLLRSLLERGYLDAFLKEGFVRPFLNFFKHCDSAEHRWNRFLNGKERTEPVSSDTRSALEDLL